MVGTDVHGHVFPGATVPFGMVQVSPDTPKTGWDGCAGYHYSDSVIRGFSMTHLLGTGIGGIGDVMLMPNVGRVFLEPGSPGAGYESSFSHRQEQAKPGYYSVFLQDPKIKVELTATVRCGLHKYTFPASDQAQIVLDLTHGVDNHNLQDVLKVEDDHTISGYRLSEGWGGKRTVYFVMQFSKPFGSLEIEQDGKRLAAGMTGGKGQSVKAVIHYKTLASEAVLVKVGISPTRIDGARKNLQAEIPGWDFDAVRAAAVAQWKKIFDAVHVETPDPHLRTTFYANLYLSCLSPTLFNDVDGAYRGMDHQNHAGGGFQNYSTFSIWDIYRAEWPLLILLQPGRIDDMVQSLLTGYHQLAQHSTPIWPLWDNETWCMIGYHSVDMIALAYLDGFRGFDAREALQAMCDTAEQDRDGLNSYKTLGYVVSKKHAQATSRTLEYAFDDWCIARMAEALGEQQAAAHYYQRSANYYHLFDRTTRFFRGRLQDGSWRSPFASNALVNDEYTEADAWQYAFSVQHDVPGLIALYGGDAGFVEKLDSLFTADSFVQSQIGDISGLIGQYSQGDEQCHHVAYLYDYAGVPYKTQQRVRQVMREFYNDTPAGQCGNVDCGQMSAWYVFSALGFYPMNPDSGIFAIGSPVVRKAVIHLDEKQYQGRTLTILAENNSAENIYIQSAMLNGQPLDNPWLTREQIISGGTLQFIMGAKPNPAWGSAPGARPPATMPANFKYPPLSSPAAGKLSSLQ